MIYLDNAATSFPKPRRVWEEQERCMRSYGGNPGRGSHRLAMRAAELAAYEEMLEKEIATLCDAVSGVSHVRVFVSFESGYVMKYTTDGEGVPITVGSGSKEQALYETVLPPRVSGVGITCAGGDRASVRQEITELVSTALGISSNRVYIAGV